MYIQIAGIVGKNTHNDEKKELFFPGIYGYIRKILWPMPQILTE